VQLGVDLMKPFRPIFTHKTFKISNVS
jgi:hypothetical protein